ncbi:MAG: hypothetical protein AB7P97_21940 [Hyphomonadaceae bacterium]
MEDEQQHEAYSDLVRGKVEAASRDAALILQRYQLARFAAKTCIDAGRELHLVGHFVGSDRVSGASPFGHGRDETVGVGLLLRIAGDLLNSATDLFEKGSAYSASALTRQMVEVEYLAWAFETRDSDAEKWLRSNREEREQFFSPRKLREAARGKFRGKDYGYHCEQGGHPVPTGRILLDPNPARDGLLMSDLLGHVGRIWDHLNRWAEQDLHGQSVTKRTPAMREKFMAWKRADPLVDLPPPP